MANDSIRYFRDALGSFATGVTIVTTVGVDGEDIGLTANSFNSVSLDPPMVLWSLAKTSGSLPAFEKAECFAVHILASDQEDLSNRFARRGTDKFADLQVRRNEAGIPLLEGCTALFQCRTAYRYEGGDHIIFVGEVIDFEHLDKPPLLFHGGRYAIARNKADTAANLPGGVEDTSLGSLVTRVYQQLVAPLRRNAEQLGLNAPARYMMNVLMADTAHELGEINGIIRHSGVEVTADIADGLVDRGLLEKEGAKFRLSPEGRRLTVALLAAAKALEADALVALNEDEQRILRDLLMRLVDGLMVRTDERVVRHMDLIKVAVGKATQEVPGS